MILGVPINGLALLVLAGGLSVASRLLGGRGTLERILGTLSAPCAEVCAVCCDEVEPFTGRCACDDDEPAGQLAPLALPPSRAGGPVTLERLPAPPSARAGR